MYLHDIGDIYKAQQRFTEAIAAYQASLALKEKHWGAEHSRVAVTLNNLGLVYQALGEYAEAKTRYERALAIAINAGEPALLWNVQGNLSHLLAAQDQRDVAILFGKLAVNTLQAQRQRLTALEENLQQSFLKDNESTYKDLADWLIDAGRLPEAEQVLAMLKEEEYFEFIRRDSTAADDLDTQASLTPFEQQQKQRFDAIAERLAALGVEYRALAQQDPLSDADEARLEALEQDLDVARDAFLTTLDDINHAFAALGADKAKALGERHLEHLENVQATLKTLGHQAVLIHTVTTDDTLHLLLTTPTVQLACKSPLGETALNKQIQAFRAVLSDPKKDPRPLAQDLYQCAVKTRH